MADLSDRQDYSPDSPGVACRKSVIASQNRSGEIYATDNNIRGVEKETNIGTFDLSNTADLKERTICEQYVICNNAVRNSNENTLSNSLDISSSGLELDDSGHVASNITNSLQTKKFPGFEHDQQLNIHIKMEDNVHDTVDKQDSISSGLNSSVNNTEIASSKDSEEVDTEEYNYTANREKEHYLEDTFESEEEESSVENSSCSDSESQSIDKLKIVVINECETDKQSLDNLKDGSNKITHGKASGDRETKINVTDASREILMTDLLSFANFQIRDVLLYMVPTVKWHPQAIYDIPWNWLNEEKWRLHTYSRYPHGANKSAILLAEAGFAYIGLGKGNDDKVICYFCCAVKQDWQPSDVIPEVHQHLSPDCSMVTGINCNNVPMTMPKSGLNLFSQLHNSREMFASEDTRQKAEDDIDRDGMESSGNGQQVNHSRQNPSTLSIGNSQNGTTANARHVLMATQTIMRPDASSTDQSETGNTRFSQPTSSDVPSTTVTSNSIFANSEADPSDFQMPVPQEDQNSVSAEPQIADRFNQNVHRFSDQTAISSSATVFSQVSQDTSTDNQNSSTVTTLPSVATSTTAISSTTSAAPSSLNTSNTSQSATQSQENSAPITTDTQNNARTAGRNPTYGELGIITERPKRFEFAVRAKRLESFEPWPRDHQLKKEDLADAGFYYAGYGDCARCFYCGGGLRNWEDNDNVWVEHARWFPKCAFIRQTMGQQFVDAVQDLNKNHDQITFEMVTTKMGSSAASFQLDTKNMPLKRDPAVITVLGMGYEDKDVLEAANFVKEVCGVLSADKLFEKLEQDGKNRKQTESSTESQAIRNSTESKDEEVMNQLKEQNNQLRQQTVCKICMDKEVAVVFLPCGHLVSCTDCAAALKDCPVCRNLVRGIVRAFMA